MTSPSRGPGILAGALALALAACDAGNRLPQVPDVAAEDFPERLRDETARMIEAADGKGGDPWANGDLAMLLHAHGQRGAAEPLYERAEALSGGEFRWAYLLGVCRQEAGEYGEAVAAFRRALSKRAYGPAAVRLGESLAAAESLAEAKTALRDAMRLEGSEAAAGYALGRVLLDLGSAEEAIPLLERTLELSPESGAARYALATAHRAAGDEGAASRHLTALAGAGRDKPSLDDPVLARVRGLAADAHHFLNEGRALASSGRLREAISAYQRALALDAGMAAAHANLVGAFGQLGDFAQAKAHYDAALSIDPRLEELHNNWGVLQASRGDPSSAAEAFRRALEVNRNSAKAHANLGVALIELGRRDAAMGHFLTAVESDPTNRPARTNLGTQALEYGRPSEAAEHFRAALDGADDGNEAFIRFALGMAYGRIGRDAAASESLERALAMAEALGRESLAVQIRNELESSRQANQHQSHEPVPAR